MADGRDRSRHEGVDYAYARCRSCRTVYVTPMPGDATIGRMYAPEYVEAHYSSELEGDDSDGELARERSRVVAEIARECPRSRVLDVGCGAGRFVGDATQSGLVCEGFEPVQAAADVAAKATGAVVHHGSLESITARYEVVHMADVLEHHPRPLELLRSSMTLLAKGGVIVARGPLEANRNLFLSMMRAKRRLRSPRVFEVPPWHVVQFTHNGWRRLIERARLRVTRESVHEVRWPVPPNATRSPQAIVRSISMRLSASPIGERLAFGNRVVSWIEP